MKLSKKVLALILAACLIVISFAFAGCSNSGDTNSDTSDVKIGVILVGDENEGYTAAHIDGIKEAASSCGISDDQIVWKYSIPEDETCYDTACSLAEEGCTTIFSNSYAHQSYMVQAAQEYPDVTFCAATGDTAAVCGLDNVKNYFTGVYESRYVSGVVAGLKLNELLEEGKVKDAKVGYVGAYPYAEVKSGYTAFYLGIKSVCDSATMEVKYTNSWFDKQAEGTTADALMDDGCVIIGQHADSEGAPAAVQARHEKGEEVYSVGYNVDMLSVAPDAALTSATNVWSVYYTYAFNCIINDEEIATNWCQGYEKGAVAITDLGTSCAEGTDTKVAEVENAIKDGTLHVFDTSTFTVDGAALTTSKFDTSTMNSDYTAVEYQGQEYECIKTDDNGVSYFSESDSEVRSAPYFSLAVDGITSVESAS